MQLWDLVKKFDKAVASTSGIGSEVSRTGRWLGRKDGHGVGEGNDVCGQLAPFAMDLYQDLEELKEGREWELESPESCHQGEAADQGQRVCVTSLELHIDLHAVGKKK